MMTQSPMAKKYSDSQVGLINIGVHGHFYQPLREDPFTGIIPDEEGADPYPNFNERITAECYRPNAEADNFELMSFNVGPTLASWLEKAHPDIHQCMVEADHRHHNALAQVYNHTILPLANAQDKRTQVRWGIQDFCHRFGRKPRGMWLAETAVDLETLDIMAQSGIQFTILSLWQAGHEVDFTEPYLIRLRENRTMTVFFYNPLSGQVSYSDAATADANAFAAQYQQYYLNRDKAAAGIPQITVIATDGELYGHHKPFRDKFLSHFLHRSVKAYGFEACSLERFLDAHPATAEATITERSSWSCWHIGLHRWSAGCECDGTTAPEQRAWKPALREALEYLQKEGDEAFEYDTAGILHDPWAARDDYIALRNGWETPERFWSRHAHRSRSDIECIRLAQNLLESQYYLQAAFTSCGFFFEDLDRIEPRNNIAFARRAISLLWQATGCDFQKGFLQVLEKAQSWRTGRTGVDLYHSLPRLPKGLLPPQ
jgi:alpha-amylase/alpha-mannosidase (GH57 family)